LGKKAKGNGKKTCNSPKKKLKGKSRKTQPRAVPRVRRGHKGVLEGKAAKTAQNRKKRRVRKKEKRKPGEG